VQESDYDGGMNLHIRDIPEGLLRKFKSWASWNGKTIKQAITELMEEAVKDYKPKQ
jgi:hypothetical protein